VPGETRAPSGRSDVLPPLYARWAAEFLGGAIPAETEATCRDCAMLAVARGTGRLAAAPFIDPHIKCCDYLPVLPNFLVGRMLADDSPGFARGRATLEARLTAPAAVSPLGVGHAAASELASLARGPSLVDGPRSLRCPHYLDEGGGQCGIWRHRAAVCATWFCKYVRGAVGQRFWHSLHRVLVAVERDLSVWCARRLGADPEAPRLSGDWAGRERDFFQACARLVDALGWRDVERACGPEVRASTAPTREAFAGLHSRAIPRRLRRGSFQVIASRRASSIVEGYAGADRLALPTRVLGALHHFDGSVSTAQALRTIRAATGLAIAPDLVRLLVDFEILVAADRD
jgi:hypothetical protein